MKRVGLLPPQRLSKRGGMAMLNSAENAIGWFVAHWLQSDAAE